MTAPRSYAIHPADFGLNRRKDAEPPRKAIPLSSLGAPPKPPPQPPRVPAPKPEPQPLEEPANKIPAIPTTLSWNTFTSTNHPNNHESETQKTYLTFHGYLEGQPCLCFNRWCPKKRRKDAAGRTVRAEWEWLTPGVELYAELVLPF